MAKIERVYNIPLRSEWLKAPPYKRAKKAVTAVREFLIKQMKSEQVKLGRMLNHKIWEHSIKTPPHHIKVSVIKYDDGVVRAELDGFPVEPVAPETKKKTKSDKKTAADTKAKGKTAEKITKKETVKSTKKVPEADESKPTAQ